MSDEWRKVRLKQLRANRLQWDTSKDSLQAHSPKTEALTPEYVALPTFDSPPSYLSHQIASKNVMDESNSLLEEKSKKSQLIQRLRNSRFPRSSDASSIPNLSNLISNSIGESSEETSSEDPFLINISAGWDLILEPPLDDSHSSNNITHFSQTGLEGPFFNWKTLLDPVSLQPFYWNHLTGTVSNILPFMDHKFFVEEGK